MPLMDAKTVAVVGGGFTGISAAYDLAKAGYKVILVEKDHELGGLAGTFEIQPGIRIEKFYHHWFTSDTAILNLIQEAGLASGLKYIPSNTGLYYANSIFRLAGPLDLLRFTAIPLLDRIRTGLMALAARRINDWKALEDQSAEEWLIRMGGKKAYETIWRPLLIGKFGPEASEVSAVWIWNKLKLRGSSRNSRGAECLIYYQGSFGALTEALRHKLLELGVQILTGRQVHEICIEGGKPTGLRVEADLIPAHIVLATIPIPQFLQITPGLPAEYRESAARIRYLGNICLVMRLKQSLSSTYWLNVADPQFPFVGIIEHTNFDDISNYRGEHIAYLSKYLPVSDGLFSKSDDEYLEYCLPYIGRMFPAFSRNWIIDHKLWKADFSQPVITRRYSSLIPDMQTPLRNLWLCSMAQIYPEDRGTNYAVAYGRKVAARIIASGH